MFRFNKCVYIYRYWRILILYIKIIYFWLSNNDIKKFWIADPLWLIKDLQLTRSWVLYIRL